MMTKKKKGLKKPLSNEKESSKFHTTPQDLNGHIEFGPVTPPVNIEFDDFKLTIEVIDETLIRRVMGDEKVEKTLLKRDCNIMIYPVEPVNKPKNITQFLQVEFERPIMIAPKDTSSFFTTFPLEIGIFVEGNKKAEVVDIFTFTKPKFTQYGELTNGIICKHWKGEVSTSQPMADPLQTGIIELTISNTTQIWMEVSKAVFNAYGMKIYYSPGLITLKGYMKILKVTMAETDFMDLPLMEGMMKSLELFKIKTPAMVNRKFVMEGGF